MKKIKIMLTVIAVVGVVGGALAFKAHNRLGVWYCSSESEGICTAEYTQHTAGGSILFCSSTRGGKCTIVKTHMVPDSK